MRNERHPEDDLPIPLRECVELLKNDSRPLSAEIEGRLTEARQAALNQFAKAKQTSPFFTDIVSWVSFGHPRMVGGVAALSVFLVVGMFMLSARHSDDAMLLGEDLPVEAFVDNGFEPWHYAENI